MVVSGIVSIAITIVCLKTTDWGVYAIVGISSIVGILRNLLFTPLYSAHCLGVANSTFYKRIFVNLANVGILLISSALIRQTYPVETWTSLFVNFIIAGIVGIIVSWFVSFSRAQRNSVIERLKNKLDK